MMIEELAKVVRSFESQISNVKALNENILSTKLDAGYVHDFEKLVQAQITLALLVVVAVDGELVVVADLLPLMLAACHSQLLPALVVKQ